MDADYQVRRRVHRTSHRENRWSMYSQRLEEIVAELMKPISDIRRSFDTDLSALLEEYLTEAGLHALSASEATDEHYVPVVPNFVELALLLQHSANLYGRKVDFLYQHVLSVSDSFHSNSQESVVGSEEATPNSARRRRRQSAAAAVEFVELALEAAGGVRREPQPARAPPTLPRMYIELEPRVLSDMDLQLFDYGGEPLGLPADFYAAWRLQNGLLVDQLCGERLSGEPALRPVSLAALQAAIEAAAPASPSADELLSPVRASTPLPLESVAGEAVQPITGLLAPELTPVVKKERKRRSDIAVDDMLDGSITMLIDARVRRKLQETREFTVSRRWIERVVSQRRSSILTQRRRLRADAVPSAGPDFRGFESSKLDIGGFVGWSQSECEAAAAGAARFSRLEPDSEDDGFFEQSSLGDSDDTHLNQSINNTISSVPEACLPWQERVARRAAAAEARGGVDVRKLASSVLAACGAGDRDTPFTQVVRAAAVDRADVSRLLLATLFLGNAGNVHIVPGASLSVDTFAVRLVSRDPSLYSEATRAEAGAHTS